MRENDVGNCKVYQLMVFTTYKHGQNCCVLVLSSLLSEIGDVLGDRKEVTGDDLDKLKYTEQVWCHHHMNIQTNQHL